MRTLLLTTVFLATLHAEEPGTPVKLDKVTAIAPASWKTEKPANRLRSHQFRLPGVGKAGDAELYIFPDLTRTVEENFARYRETMILPEGKPVPPAETKTVGKLKLAVLDLQGTWLFKDRPFDPKAKVEPKPDMRVISAILETPDGNYLIRLSGPAATVNGHAADFRKWLESFR